MGDSSPFFEQIEEIPKLTMDITTDGDGSLYGLDVGLLKEKCLDSSAENSNVFLGDDLALENRID